DRPIRDQPRRAAPHGRGGAFWKERETMDWRHHAECLKHDPELFFPIGNTGPAITQIQEAKAVCQSCDVMTACLKFALETGQDSGVWGGLSEDERRSLKRRNARARRASCPHLAAAEPSPRLRPATRPEGQWSRAVVVRGDRAQRVSGSR